MTDMILKDPAGDVLEFEDFEGGGYVSIEQDGQLTTAGPFTAEDLRNIFRIGKE